MERFWRKVKKTDTCWLWTAYKDSFGYGAFGFDGRIHKAHRVAWILTHGEIPSDKILLHSCDNPSCVRPDHLSLGTPKQNTADCVTRGRRGDLDATETWHSTFSWDQVALIRSLYKSGAKQSELCKQFNASKQVINKLVHNKTYITEGI